MPISISEREIWDEMSPFIRVTPLDVARNIALSSLLLAKGIRLKSRSLFGLRPPEIAPPYEIWWDPSVTSFWIDQPTPTTTGE